MYPDAFNDMLLKKESINYTTDTSALPRCFIESWMLKNSFSELFPKIQYLLSRKSVSVPFKKFHSRIAREKIQSRDSKLIGGLIINWLHNRNLTGKFWTDNQCARDCIHSRLCVRRKIPYIHAKFPSFFNTSGPPSKTHYKSRIF